MIVCMVVPLWSGCTPLCVLVCPVCAPHQITSMWTDTECRLFMVHPEHPDSPVGLYLEMTSKLYMMLRLTTRWVGWLLCWRNGLLQTQLTLCMHCHSVLHLCRTTLHWWFVEHKQLRSSFHFLKYGGIPPILCPPIPSRVFLMSRSPTLWPVTGVPLQSLNQSMDSLPKN